MQIFYGFLRFFISVYGNYSTISNTRTSGTTSDDTGQGLDLQPILDKQVTIYAPAQVPGRTERSPRERQSVDANFDKSSLPHFDGVHGSHFEVEIHIRYLRTINTHRALFDHPARVRRTLAHTRVGECLYHP